MLQNVRPSSYHAQEGTVKKLACMICLVIVAGVLTACVFPGSKLKPGDRIGQMELTTEYDLNINYLCGFDELDAGTCRVPDSVSVLGVSTGWAEDTLEQLEAAWTDSVWTLTIDDREVNLPSFGTFDLDWGEQKARVWDVGLSSLALGEHTVRYEFSLENSVERGNHTVVYQFTVVAAPPTGGP
jgi:hypothetical protein